MAKIWLGHYYYGVEASGERLEIELGVLSGVDPPRLDLWRMKIASRSFSAM